MPKYFEISGNCPPDQRAIFEAINTGLGILGASADEFDTHFRVQLMHACLHIAFTAENSIKANIRVEGDNETELLVRRLKYEDMQPKGGLMKISFSPDKPFSATESARILNIVRKKVPVFTTDMARGFADLGFKGFQDVARTKLPPAECQIFDKFSGVVGQEWKPRKPKTSDNFLQQYANGKSFLHGNRTFLRYELDSNSIHVTTTLETPAYAAYSVNVMSAVFYDLAKVKRFPDERYGESINPLIQQITAAVVRLSNRQPSAAVSSLPISDQYPLSGNLQAPEQHFFDTLNQVLKLCQCNVEEFDTNLKFRMAGQLYNSAVFSGVPLKEQIEHDYPGIVLERDEFYKHIKMQIEAHGRSIGRSLPLAVVTRQSDLSAPEIARLFNAHQSGNDDLHSNLAQALFRAAKNHGLGEVFNFHYPQRKKRSAEDPLQKVISCIASTLKSGPAPIQIGPINAERLLLASYMGGSRRLSELSDQPVQVPWNNYSITLPHQQSFLINSLIETATIWAHEKGLDPNKPPFTEAFRELEEAFSNAVQAPHGAHEQAERQLLTFLPYGMRSGLESIQTRATRTTPPPDIELLDAWNQIRPLPGLLNCNIGAHRQLGDTLLAGKNNPVLGVLDHICTGKPLPQTEEVPNAATRKLLVDISSEPVEKLAPTFKTAGLREQFISNNRESHRAVIEVLTQAPLLVIAALGTPDMIREACETQAQLFPGKKNMPEPEMAALLWGEFSTIAARALENAYQAETRPIPNSLADTIAKMREEKPLPGWLANYISVNQPRKKPPSPPPASGSPSLPSPSQSPSPSPEFIPPPPRGLEAAAIATSAVIAGVATSGLPQTAPVAPVLPTPIPPVPSSPQPSVSTANDDGGFTARWDEIHARAVPFVEAQLKESPPFNMYRCNLGSEPGHSINLHLTRWVKNGGNTHERVETRSMNIPLKEPDLDVALDTKIRLQSEILSMDNVKEHRRLHVKNSTTGENVLPDATPVIESRYAASDGKPGGLIIQDGIYCLRLAFPPSGRDEGTVVEMPLGVRKNGGDAREADSRRIKALQFLENAAHARRRVTIRDVQMSLREAISRKSGKWDQVETIDLSKHTEITRNITVEFPDRRHHQSTRLHVGNPKLKRTPNLSWVIPVEIYVRGEQPRTKEVLIAEPTINTHVSDGAMALKYIPEITSHYQKELEDHAKRHEEACWYLPDEALEQLTPKHSSETNAVDWTWLDCIKDKLGYARRLEVRVEPYPIPDDGAVNFTLTVQRKDSSVFYEKLCNKPLPLQQTYSIPLRGTPDETKAAIEQFRSSVQEGFAQQLNEAYSARPGTPAAPESAVKRQAASTFNPQTVVNMFTAARRHALAESIGKDAGIVELPGRNLPATAGGNAAVQRLHRGGSDAGASASVQ